MSCSIRVVGIAEVITGDGKVGRWDEVRLTTEKDVNMVEG